MIYIILISIMVIILCTCSFITVFVFPPQKQFCYHHGIIKFPLRENYSHIMGFSCWHFSYEHVHMICIIYFPYCIILFNCILTHKTSHHVSTVIYSICCSCFGAACTHCKLSMILLDKQILSYSTT